MLLLQVASKTQARVITYSIIVINIAFVGIVIGLLLGQGSWKTLADLHPLYSAQLILGSICLGLLTITLLWLGSSIRRSKREQRTWSKRQLYFRNTAAVLVRLAMAYSAISVSVLALVLDQLNCQYPWVTIAVLDFMQRFFFSGLMLFLLVRLHNMKLWRGDGVLDMNPDSRLLVDRPLRDRARSHVIAGCVWAVMVAMRALNMTAMIQQYNRGARQQFGVGCSLQINDLVCNVSSTAVVAAILSFAGVLTFVLIWGLMARRALKDHKQLPYCRYKETSIFIRVQTRVVGPVQVAIVLAVIILELVPSLQGRCMGVVTAQMGNLLLELSLTLAAIIVTILYMPTSSSTDSPLQQELLQEFSWTQAAVPADVQCGNQQLAASQAASRLGDKDDSLMGYLEYMPGLMAQGMGELAQVQDTSQATEQLRHEPIFCMETSARLFYWSRLAYRNEEGLDYKWVNAAEVKRLFDLQHTEAMWDSDTNAHCVIGWSGTQAVVAFRGTSTIQNTMNDLKAWRVPHHPKRHHRSRMISVHAGFNKAWVHNDFNKKVLAKLGKISKAATQPLHLWITGHSLGGALAVLASLDIHTQHPDSQMTTYTFGCPRIGACCQARRSCAAPARAAFHCLLPASTCHAVPYSSKAHRG